MDNKDRFFIAVFILIVVMLFLIFLSVIKVEQQEKEVIQIQHIVMSGENLTQLADKYYEDMYLLKAIQKIKTDNNMATSDLQIGQVIKINK
jgi:LysM repeat protein